MTNKMNTRERRVAQLRLMQLVQRERAGMYLNRRRGGTTWVTLAEAPPPPVLGVDEAQSRPCPPVLGVDEAHTQ